MKRDAKIDGVLIPIQTKRGRVPEIGAHHSGKLMSEEQPTFKVVDRRPFNPDGSPRELSEHEKEEADRAAKAVAVENAAAQAVASEPAPAPTERPRPSSPQSAEPHSHAGEPHTHAGDPLDDPASFLSLVMSLASNAAASLGMMPHPATGETEVDLQVAKHWIDVLGMLERKTKGNLDRQEALALENLLADLRMQYVSFTNSPTPPPSKFSANDITGGK
jgi:uncharacterized protein DUF1844